MIEKTNKCSNCNNTFDWYYLVPTEKGTDFKMHRRPKDKEPVRMVLSSYIRAGRKIPTIVLVDCPQCNKSNRITVEY